MNFKVFLLIFALSIFLSKYPPIFSDISDISVKSKYRYIRKYRYFVPWVEVRLHNLQSKKLDQKTISGYFIGYCVGLRGSRFNCSLHTIRVIELSILRIILVQDKGQEKLC